MKTPKQEPHRVGWESMPLNVVEVIRLSQDWMGLGGKAVIRGELTRAEVEKHLAAGKQIDWNGWRIWRGMVKGTEILWASNLTADKTKLHRYTSTEGSLHTQIGLLIDQIGR